MLGIVHCLAFLHDVSGDGSAPDRGFTDQVVVIINISGNGWHWRQESPQRNANALTARPNKYICQNKYNWSGGSDSKASCRNVV